MEHHQASHHNAHTIILDQPITRGEGDKAVEITSITIRKPIAGELSGLAISDLIRMDASTVIQALPRITEPALVPPEVNAMDPADLFQCATAISSFFLKKALRAEIDLSGTE